MDIVNPAKDGHDSDESTFSARQPPNKRPIASIFSPNSSDSDDDEDDEVATLSGSQPFTMDSQEHSPAFGTQEDFDDTRVDNTFKLKNTQKSIQSKGRKTSTAAVSALITANPKNSKRIKAPPSTLDSIKENIENRVNKKCPWERGETQRSTQKPASKEKKRAEESVLIQATNVLDQPIDLTDSKFEAGVEENSSQQHSNKQKGQAKKVSQKPSSATRERGKSPNGLPTKNLTTAPSTSKIEPKQTQAVSSAAETKHFSSPKGGSKQTMPAALGDGLKPKGEALSNVPTATAVKVSNSPLRTSKKKGGKTKSTGQAVEDSVAPISKDVISSIQGQGPNTSTTAKKGAKTTKSSKKSGTKAAVPPSNDVTSSEQGKSLGTSSTGAKRLQGSIDINPQQSGKETSKKSSANAPPNVPAKSAPQPARKAPEKKTGKAKAAKPPSAATKKPKKMSFQDQVVNKLFWSFKPFTLRSLSEELKVPESTVEFCMLSLVDKGIALKKDFTSAKGRVKTLYWANHDTQSKQVNLGRESSVEERHSTKQHVQELQAQDAQLKQQLVHLMAQPSNADLSAALAKAEQDLVQTEELLKTMKQRIEDHKSQTVTSKKRPYSACSSQGCSPRSMKVRINHMRGEWKKRKDKCRDFIELFADGMEKKPKDVIKLLDLETDEACGATLPPKYSID